MNKLDKVDFIEAYGSDNVKETHPELLKYKKFTHIIQKTNMSYGHNRSLSELTEEDKEIIDHYHDKDYPVFYAASNKSDPHLDKLINAKTGDIVHVKDHLVGHGNIEDIREHHHYELNEEVPKTVIRVRSNNFNPIKITPVVGEDFYEHMILHPGKYIKLHDTKYNDKNIHEFYRADDSHEETK